MHDIAPRTALITGAGSGSGCELSRLFAQDGHDLWLADRPGAALQALAQSLRSRHQVRVTTIPVDLSQSRAPYAIHEQVRAQGAVISYLVNDAGVGVSGTFDDVDLDQQLLLIQRHLTNALVLAKLFLRDMLIRDEGRILLMAALPAADAPSAAVCSASNAFILDFSQVVADELRNSHVCMSALLPAAVPDEREREPAPADAGRIARAAYRTLMLGRSTPPWVASPANHPARRASPPRQPAWPVLDGGSAR